MCNISCAPEAAAFLSHVLWTQLQMPPGCTERGITVSFFLPNLSSFLKYNKQWRWQRTAGIWVWRGWGWWRGGGRRLQAFWWQWKWNGDRNSGLCVNSESSVSAVHRTISALAPWEPRVQHQDLGEQSLCWWCSLCNDCCWAAFWMFGSHCLRLQNCWLRNPPASSTSSQERAQNPNQLVTPEYGRSCIPKSLHVWECTLQFDGHVKNRKGDAGRRSSAPGVPKAGSALLLVQREWILCPAFSTEPCWSSWK